MLGVILQILSMLGIILLILLILLAAAAMLVLFFPVAYRVRGSKDDKGLTVSAKAGWLFGLLRIKYSYPESKGVVVKFLCFTVFDSASQKEKKPKGKASKKKASNKKKPSEKELSEKETSTGSNRQDIPGNAVEENAAGSASDAIIEDGSRSESDAGTEESGKLYISDSADESGGKGKLSFFKKIFQKFEKIKYTICNIYDKIKKIWENISYYLELLREDDTKQLFSHAIQRIAKIFKNIRPRRIKADILFGTGAPDTTGYIYGVYCMASAFLGKGFWLTPDFEQAVFKGEFDISGHVTICVLLANGLKLLLDKKLRRFVNKLKAIQTKNMNRAA